MTESATDALVAAPEAPGSPKPDAMLVADNVVRRFGGLVAVDVEHLEIQRGVITALIGPNGAGKTTLFNLLTGFDRANTGTWTFNGEPLHGVSSYRAARRGVVRTFQLTKALSKLSVLQNMMLGARGQRGERFLPAFIWPMWLDNERSIQSRAEVLLERFNLAHMRDEFAGTLSGGQRKLLEMARALMVEPDLLMLDEPTAGVNPALTQSLLEHVKDLRTEGLTIVFVEHDMDVVRDISNWVVVMAEGRVISEGRHETIVADPQVIDAYLGSHHEAARPESEPEDDA